MSKFVRKISTLVLSLCACICLAFGVSFAFTGENKAMVASAESTGTFVIEPGASARISENCGIRFTAYFDDTFYNEIVEGESIKSSYQLGMIIVPSYYYEDCNNYAYNTGYDGGYYEYFRDIKGKMIDLPFEYSDISVDATYGYSVKGAIVNMKANNLDLEYAAVGYLKTTTANGDVYRYTDVSLPRSVRYVAAKAIEDNAYGSATLNTLYGMEGMASYNVETYLQAETGEYILAEEKSLYTYAAVGANIDYSASAPEFDGYYLNASSSTLSGQVKEDGSLVLKLYYTMDKGFMVDGNTNNPAKPITVDFDTAYGYEENSVKLTFNEHKYANFRLTALNGIASATEGYVTFYLKNETGVALEVYTGRSLNVVGGTTKLSADANWQKVTLYVDNTGDDTFTVNLRSLNEATVLNGVSVYLSKVTTDIVAESPEAVESSFQIVGSKTQWQDPASCETTDEMLYNGAKTTKLGFKAGYKYGDMSFAFDAGLDFIGEQVDFYLYNNTGVALDIYTDPAKWSGVVSLSAATGWQKVSLYAPLTAEGGSFTVHLRGAGESVVNASEIKYVYISPVQCVGEKGTFADFTTAEGVAAGVKSNWQGATYASSSEMQYNGQDTLKMNLSVGSYGAGVWLNTTANTGLLSNLLGAIGTNDIESVTLSFYYNATQVTGNANYIGISVGDHYSIALDKSAGWHKYSFTLTNAPANFILNVSKNNGSDWEGGSFSISGILYVSNIEYQVNKSTPADHGVYADFTNDAGVNAMVSKWNNATYASSFEKTFNGQNTLRLDLGIGSYGDGVFLNKTLLNELVAMVGSNGVESITLSFYYNASTVVGNANYIGLSVGSDSHLSLDKSYGWHKYSFDFTSAPENFILNVSKTKACGWESGTFRIDGILYVSNIEYTINYAGEADTEYTVDAVDKSRDENGLLQSFESSANISANTSSWLGSVGCATSDTYGDVAKLELSSTAWGGAGFFLSSSAKAYVNTLLQTEGISGVRVSFKYFVEEGTSGVSYVGLFEGNTKAIAGKGAWYDFEYVMTKPVENLILGVFANQAASWTGGTVNCVTWFTDVFYEIQYENTSSITVETLADKGITKVEIAQATNNGAFTLTAPNAMTSGGVEFSILNKTGRAFYVYTDATAWSGKVKVLVSNSWQTVSLYVPNGATAVTVYVETVDGRTFNPTQTSKFYIANVTVVNTPSESAYIVKGGETDYQIVYANDASAAEINAAETLQEIIAASTGVTLEITNYSAKTAAKFIAVGGGFTETVSFGETDADAYCVKIDASNNIFIYGVKDRGTSYAVLDFAEKYFGYVYTENEYTIESVSDLNVSDIEECVFVPTVSMRAYLGYDTMTHVYAGVMSRGINQELCYNTRQNTFYTEGAWETDYNWADYTGATEKFGYIGEKTHNTQNTLTAGVSAYNAKYGTSFNAADFYSINNPSNGLDICFTKSVNGVSSVDFVALALMNLIDANYDKGVKYYIFEQEDYASPICVCNGCKQAATALNGASGLNIWFINQVIDKIDSNGYADYDYKITTYAYFETKTAPTAVASYAGVNTAKTYSNVANEKIVIRFAFIGQDYHYGIYDTRVDSKAILDGWKSYIGENETMFWLYDTDFSYYPGYFPALNCIADNVYAAKLFNASAVYINGAYDAPHDWDQKLRRYVYSKMLWNFDETAYLRGDADSDGVNDYVKEVAMEYLHSYYGTDNGNLVWEIIQAYESGSTSKTVEAGGKSDYNLGSSFYKTQFDKIFLGNGSTTGLYYTNDETLQLRLKEVMLSIVADLKYVASTSYYLATNVNSYVGTTNTRDIFLSLAEEVGFTQWCEDYNGDGEETVDKKA